MAPLSACSDLPFRLIAREGVTGGPKLLIVAPMSGHYATLLRGTVARMVERHRAVALEEHQLQVAPAQCADPRLGPRGIARGGASFVRRAVRRAVPRPSRSGDRAYRV